MPLNQNWIKESIERGATLLEESHAFNIDRTKYMTSSEADSCIRKQWYSKHSPEAAAAQQWGYARRGRAVERYVVEALRAANFPLHYAGDEQTSFADEETKISATPDGLIVFDDESYGLEIKSIDPRTNRKNLPRPAHVTQLKIAMALMAKKGGHDNITKGLLVYVDASNFDDIVQVEIPAEPKILERMADRAKRILTARSADNLDREGKINNDCRYCAFTKICGVDISDESGKRRANRGSNLHGLVESFLDIKTLEAEQKTQKAELSEDIKSELKKRDTTELTIGGAHVALQSVKGRISLDKKAVAAAGIDLSSFEKTSAASERLIVETL